MYKYESVLHNIIRYTIVQLSWDEAKATCERQGQKLASVRSKEEQAELEKVLKG